MDYFLIIILGIVVLSIWNGSRDTNERLQNELARLEREIDFLRSQLAALVKANAASTTATAAPAVRPPSQPAAGPVFQSEPPKPATATYAPVPPIAAFRAVAGPVPPTQPAASPARPAPTQPPSQPPAPSAANPTPEPRLSTSQIPPDALPPPSQAPQTLAPPVARSVHPATAAAHSTTPTPEPAATGGGLFSFEQTLGANWLNKLGIAILVIGLAFFLAVKLQTWGPAGKVLCGFAVSIALLAGGVWLERKATYRIFARGALGGGWALAFFTTFAMYHLPAARVITSLPADLVWMLIIAAGMVGHSLKYRSQTVTSLAFMLGFATLLTSHIEEPNQTVIFSLTASLILAVALVVITTIRHWAVLELCGLIAVYLSHLVWLTKVLPENHLAFAEFWPSTALILLYWLIFRLAYVLRTPLDKREENISSVSAVLNSGGVLGLLKFQSAHPEWAFWALIALGSLEMALAFWAKPKRRQAFVVLSTIATVLLIASVPFRFHGVSWPVLWLVQAQVLAICGLRLGEPVFRRIGLLTGIVTGGVLAFHDVLPLVSFRLDSADSSHHWSLTVALTLAALLYWTHAEVYPRRWPQINANALEAFALRVTSWLALGSAATALWVVLPDQWLPVGWIALFLALVFLGHHFSAVLPALEGDVVAFAAAGVLVFHQILPLAFFRLSNADLSHHASKTVVLGIAAAAWWLRGEVFPRVLTPLDPEGSKASGIQAWHAFVLPCSSWLGLGAATAALWVVLPDQWLPVGWLALFLVLVFVGHRFKATMPPLEGDILSFVAAGVLAFHQVLPLVFFRLGNADASHHLALTTALGLAALAFWIRGEVFPRVLPKLPVVGNWDPGAWEAVILPLASFLGAAAAGAALWVVLPSAWVAVGWLALVVLLGLAADWSKSVPLAAQADTLAIASILWLNGWDLWKPDWVHRTPLLIAVALLYCGMGRKTVTAGSRNYVPAAYSWAAAWFLPFLAFDIFKDPWVAPVLAALALALFEIGRFTRKGFLRWQGYSMIAIAFTEYLSGDLAHSVFGSSLAGGFSFIHSRLFEVILLLGAGYWLLERTRSRECCSRLEHAVGLTADATGTLCLVVWLAVRFPFYVSGGEAWIAALWAGVATVLLALAWLMRRRSFLVQAVVLAVAAVLRGLLFDLATETTGDFWHGPLFHLAFAALILMAALPFAFQLRAPEFWTGATFELPDPFATALLHPEQWFFFAPFGLMVAALGVKLTSGHITIGWSLLGLGAFLFALAVGERSFRLAGLALLLISVAKILLMDVWALSPSDRYTTLIILGLALVTVSFLYTRFSSVIRRYL